MPPHPTIALVEDDPSFSRAVSRFLRVSGYDVRAFASAEEFLGGPSEAYGCLILDNQLPGISGLELFHQLPAATPAVTAIFISAQDEGDVREKVSRLPGCAFLRKPFVITELLEAVQEQFARRPYPLDPLSPDVDPEDSFVN